MSLVKVHGFAYSRKTKSLLIDFKSTVDLRPKCKKLRFQKISTKESVDSVVRALQLRYTQYFTSDVPAEQTVLTQQLAKAVEQLLNDWRGSSNMKSSEDDNVQDDRQHSRRRFEDVDLNKVSEEENIRAKQLMDVSFEAKRLKPGDADFEWDKRVDFAPPQALSEWDDDE